MCCSVLQSVASVLECVAASGLTHESSSPLSFSSFSDCLFLFMFLSRVFNCVYVCVCVCVCGCVCGCGCLVSYLSFANLYHATLPYLLFINSLSQFFISLYTCVYIYTYVHIYVCLPRSLVSFALASLFLNSQSSDTSVCIYTCVCTHKCVQQFCVKSQGYDVTRLHLSARS